MLKDGRLQKILQYLEEHQTATLKQLSTLNQVSLDTVRRDLARLEAEGRLRRVRGGAILEGIDVTAQLPEQEEPERKQEKQAIASLLGPFITDGQAVALSGGTTCAEVAAFLVKNYYRLTVLTNNLRALEILAEAPTFTVLVPGGIVDTDTDELFGQQCEEDIQKYNLDVAVLGAYAVSAEKGLTDDRFYQKGILQAMINAARTKILVADATKFGRTACVNICPLDRIDIVVSDTTLSAEEVQKLEAIGLQVVI